MHAAEMHWPLVRGLATWADVCTVYAHTESRRTVKFGIDNSRRVSTLFPAGRPPAVHACARARTRGHCVVVALLLLRICAQMKTLLAYRRCC